MEKKGGRLLGEEGVGRSVRVFTRFLDMRYEGQSFEIPVPVPSGRLGVDSVRSAVRRFHVLHESRYGYKDEENRVEIVNLRVYCKGRVRQALPRPSLGRTQTSPRAHREAFIGSKWVESCPIFERSEVPTGSTGRGPCIVEDYDSTLVLPARASFMVDRTWSFRISL